MSELPARHSASLLLLKLLGHLPLAVLYALARVGSFFLHCALGYRRQVVRDNLRKAFAQKNAKERTVLEKSVYQNLTQVAVETLRAKYMPQEAFEHRIHTVGGELLREASDNFNRSLIILTLHQGNWEWMLHSTRTYASMPLVPVYKPLHNRAVNTLMREIRSRFGASPLALSDISSDLLQNRREARCYLMLADQSPIEGEREYWIPFFGRRTAFHAGPARLARMLGAAVVFASCTRTATGYYAVRYELLAGPEEKLNELDITQRYATAVERAIRAQPQSWLWTNRRWKRSPATGNDNSTLS